MRRLQNLKTCKLGLELWCGCFQSRGAQRLDKRLPSLTKSTGSRERKQPIEFPVEACDRRRSSQFHVPRLQRTETMNTAIPKLPNACTQFSNTCRVKPWAQGCYSRKGTQPIQPLCEPCLTHTEDHDRRIRPDATLCLRVLTLLGRPLPILTAMWRPLVPKVVLMVAILTQVSIFACLGKTV